MKIFFPDNIHRFIIFEKNFFLVGRKKNSKLRGKKMQRANAGYSYVAKFTLCCPDVSFKQTGHVKVKVFFQSRFC